MESPERIWQLMAKVLNQESSALEKEELYHLLRNNKDLQQQYELLDRIWKEKESHKGDEEDARKHIAKIITRAETEPADEEYSISRRRRRRLVTAGLFSLLVFAVAVWWSFNFFNSSSSIPAEELDREVLVAKNGSRTRSSLPDGTTVWLNAGSKLFLTSDFTGTTREVRLEGEAFFDVIKKPQQPFIVHTSGIDIKVLGTAFNVKAYPEDKTIETTLLRGVVQVFDLQDGLKDPIQLKPNQKLILPKKTTALEVTQEDKKPPVIKVVSAFTITPIDSTKKENERIETAWVYSRLEFRGDRFEELARKMERWYNVSIAFTDEKVKQLSFNGSFEKETVEQAFTALKEAKSFTYKINKHEILIGSSE